MTSRRMEAGFGLILLIGFIAVSSLLISATSLAFIVNGRALQLRIDRVKAYYLAQAGIMQAIQDWRDSSDTLLSRRYDPLNTTVTGNQIFKASQCASDFAMYSLDQVDTADWTAGNRRLRAWKITNISNATSFQVTKIKVTWSPVGTANLETVKLNNNTVVTVGSYASGTEITLSGSAANRTLNAGGNWSGNDTILQWTAEPPDPVTVNVEWTFSDDSGTLYSKSHPVTYWSGPKSGVGAPIQHSFAITSTGQVNQTLLKTLSTVKAVISANVAANAFEIIDWDGVDKNQA